MKKLIFIFLLIGMTSCTLDYYAETKVECPCIVKRINAIKDQETITVYNSYNNWFSFETTSVNYYHLGDTIK